ncbi:hypothetical protein ACRFAB_27240, partial [Klebsiella pneumoniae]
TQPATGETYPKSDLFNKANEYSKMWMTETNNIRLDLYRFDNLDKLLQIITRMKVRELYAA